MKAFSPVSQYFITELDHNSKAIAVTPQRMRMIVHAIEETLDNGLQKNGQVVVSPVMLPIRLSKLIPSSL